MLTWIKNAHLRFQAKSPEPTPKEVRALDVMWGVLARRAEENAEQERRQELRERVVSAVVDWTDAHSETVEQETGLSLWWSRDLNWLFVTHPRGLDKKLLFDRKTAWLLGRDAITAIGGEAYVDYTEGESPQQTAELIVSMIFLHCL